MPPKRARLAAVLPGLAGLNWSIDTRKAAIMAQALGAGAALVNDVSALGHDPAALALVATRRLPGRADACAGHARYDAGRAGL